MDLLKSRLSRPLSAQGISLQCYETSWLYEYFFEPNFAGTRSIQGVADRTLEVSHYPNVSDIDELYDLASDPAEMKNIASDSAVRSQLELMCAELFRLLKAT
jgi:hypothetical protein